MPSREHSLGHTCFFGTNAYTKASLSLPYDLLSGLQNWRGTVAPKASPLYSRVSSGSPADSL